MFAPLNNTQTVGFEFHLRSLPCAFGTRSVLKPVVQSLNSPFFPPHIGAEPGRAKEESRITCMRMLRTPPCSPPKSGKKNIYIYMLFTGREVRMGKKLCPKQLCLRPRAVLKTKGTVFSHTDRPSPVNNIFIFFWTSSFYSQRASRMNAQLQTFIKYFIHRFDFSFMK